MIGAEIIANSIVAHGLKRAYVYPGGTIAPILDVLDKLNVEFVVGRSEQGSAYAALAETRLTGKPQVVMVTSGPGVMNVATVVADAYCDSVPLVIITGQVGTSDMARVGMRQRGFQEVKTVEMMTPIAKHVVGCRRADRIKQNIEDAFWIASHGRPGPVVVDLPMNLQRGEASDDCLYYSPDKYLGPSKEYLQRTIDWLHDAQRPVVIAGHGVILSMATDWLRGFVHKANIPVSQSLMGIGSIPSDDPLCLGFHGHTGNKAAGQAIYNSDFLLVLGSRLDVRQTGTLFNEFAPNAKIVVVDIDETELDNLRVPTQLNIHCDVNQFLFQLAVHGWSTNDARDEWVKQVNTWKQEAIDKENKASRDTLQMVDVIKCLDELTKGQKVIVTTGVGLHQQFVARHFTFDWPNRILLTSGGLGAMGFDLPAAVGAALAKPDYKVLCIVGDGSFQMNLQELATIKEHNLSIKIIVVDNNRLAMVSQFQNMTWGKDLTCGNKWNPGFADIALAYGIGAEYFPRIMDNNNVEIFRTMLKAWISDNDPCLIHCKTDPTEDISPMLLGGQRIDQPWEKA